MSESMKDEISDDQIVTTVCIGLEFTWANADKWGYWEDIRGNFQGCLLAMIGARRVDAGEDFQFLRDLAAERGNMKREEEYANRKK